MRDQGVNILVSLLTDHEATELDLCHEASLATDLGIDFRSFPIPDRRTPDSSDDTTKFLDALLLSFLSGDSIAVHCRMGIGRSSLVAATILALAGALPGDAFDMVSSARGMPVPDTDEQREWVAKFVHARRRCSADGL